MSFLDRKGSGSESPTGQEDPSLVRPSTLSGALRGLLGGGQEAAASSEDLALEEGSALENAVEAVVAITKGQLLNCSKGAADINLKNKHGRAM